ncbi:ureidoglycolate lyase [Hymenobacter psoromatis]|nr:ureidoglycolate lyase [Hymenobacter psoromatis]
MKLISYGPVGHEKPGVLLGHQLYSATPVTAAYDEAFFAGDGLARLREYLARPLQQLEPVPLATRLGSPVARPSKIVGVGFNYAAHAQASGQPLPTEPALFLKATSALSGPHDPIVLPPGSRKTDWEVELAVVIKRTARYVSEAEAPAYVAGYALFDDLSERAYQLERGGSADKGKGCDSFAPLGPYLVTPDEVPNPANLGLWLRVNGRLMQQGSTRHLLFSVPYLVAYISRFMTLLPGDVIATGTPTGTGYHQSPPVFLRAGDVVEAGISGLGSSRQHCVRHAQAAVG